MFFAISKFSFLFLCCAVSVLLPSGTGALVTQLKVDPIVTYDDVEDTIRLCKMFQDNKLEAICHGTLNVLKKTKTKAVLTTASIVGARSFQTMTAQTTSTSSMSGYPPVSYVNEPKTCGNQCPDYYEQLQQNTAPPQMDISPWSYFEDVNFWRWPQVISKACCDCTHCVDMYQLRSTGAGSEFFSIPLTVTVDVILRINDGIDFGSCEMNKTCVVEEMEIPIGCTCQYIPYKHIDVKK